MIGVHLVLAGIVLAPFFSVAIPGLGDTLNHLARMHILATIDRSPALQRFYEVHWAPIPYLAMDAIVPLLMRVVPIYMAGKLFVAACIVLPVAGTVSLHYAVHRRASLVPCAAWLVATNALLSLGFLNFLFSAGCALLLFAAWVATTPWPRWPRAGLFALPVLLLYFGHVFACAAYCLAVAGYECGRAVRARFRPASTCLSGALAALAQALPAMALAATLDVSSGYVGPLHTQFGSITEKLAAAVSPLLFLHDAVHGVVLLCTVGLAVLLAPRLRLDRRVWPAALVVFLVAAAVPHVLASTWGTDLRLPLVAALLGLAAISLRLGTPARLAALVGLLALVGAKSTDSWAALHAQDALFADTRAVLADLPRGARLLVVSLTGHGTGREAVPISTLWHMPMVAVIEHDAFLPTLFTGLSTVHVRPAFLAVSTPNGLPISPDQLRDGEAADGVASGLGDGQGARFYHFGWPANFDFVLVQRFDGDAGRLPARLSLVRRVGGLDLYRILPP